MRSQFTKIDWHHPINVLLWAPPAHAFLVFSSMTSLNVVVLSEIEDTGWGGSRNRSTADNVSVETWREPRKPTSATLSHTHVTNAGCKTFLGGPPPPPPPTTTRSNNVFPVHQRSVLRPPAVSDPRNDPGETCQVPDKTLNPCHRSSPLPRPR